MVAPAAKQPVTGAGDVEILVVPYRADNYGYLIHDPRSGATLAIDAGDDAGYLEALATRNWRLGWILLTHHHDDHVSHAGALAAKTGAQICGPQSLQLPGHNIRALTDQSPLHLGKADAPLEVQILATPGHTLDMLNYYLPAATAVFTGDTLFTLGSGRLFEGTADLMFDSLQKLGALPANTRVYGGHEYTRANLDFALSVEPDLAALRDRAETLRATLAAGEPTVPTRLSDELMTNPFLRAKTAEDLARVRAAKDAF